MDDCFHSMDDCFHSMDDCFHSTTVQRSDGRWLFIATEEGKVFQFVHLTPFVQFTEDELLRMKLDAMNQFDQQEAPCSTHSSD